VLIRPASRASTWCQHIDLSAAEIQLVNEVGREQSLAAALHPVLDATTTSDRPASPPWAYSPSTAGLLDGVIIPTECEYFSLRGLPC